MILQKVRQLFKKKSKAMILQKVRQWFYKK